MGASKVSGGKGRNELSANETAAKAGKAQRLAARPISQS
jgi:hypothetical protein